MINTEHSFVFICRDLSFNKLQYLPKGLFSCLKMYKLCEYLSEIAILLIELSAERFPQRRNKTHFQKCWMNQIAYKPIPVKNVFVPYHHSFKVYWGLWKRYQSVKTYTAAWSTLDSWKVLIFVLNLLKPHPQTYSLLRFPSTGLFSHNDKRRENLFTVI